MSTRDLPVRANLENLRKQAKGLHRAFLDGDTDAVDRIRENLPRINELPEAEVAEADLSRQEAQHVLAREYGYATWEKLRAAVGVSFEGSSFEDLARLTDREIQNLMREISQKDLCRALVGASEAVWGRTLSNMSRRVRIFITEESERLAPDLPDYEPHASRQRLLEWAEALGRDGRIQWPPPANHPAWSGDLTADVLAPPPPLAAWRGGSFAGARRGARGGASYGFKIYFECALHRWSLRPRSLRRRPQKATPLEFYHK